MDHFSSSIMKEWNIIDLAVFVNCFTHILHSKNNFRDRFKAYIASPVQPADRPRQKISLFCPAAKVQYFLKQSLFIVLLFFSFQLTEFLQEFLLPFCQLLWSSDLDFNDHIAAVIAS